MNILIIGSGGREHTFAWKIKQSPLCNDLYVAPGNAGTAQLAKNLPIGVSDFEALAQACVEQTHAHLSVDSYIGGNSRKHTIKMGCL